jgi:hypothetical protein
VNGAYNDDEPPSLLNPAVLVEVTSDSSENYDSGKKFLHYQGLESLTRRRAAGFSRPCSARPCSSGRQVAA